WRARRDVADAVHHRVGGVAGAGGVSDVAVGEHDRQIHLFTEGVRGVLGALGPHGGPALGIEPGDPGAPADELADRLDSGLGGRHGLVIAHQRHAGGVLVEAARVRALHRPVQAAAPALEDLPVLVDQRVVADVAPVQGLRVVGVDGPHDARRLGAGVVVAPGGVVHGDPAEEVVVGGGHAVDGFVGAPLASGDDARP